jgi:hypothetical protein
MPTPPSSATKKNYAAICSQLDELLTLANQPAIAAIRADEVSGWSVGEQLEHLLLADQRILDGLEALLDGNLDSGGAGPTGIGRLILLLEYIPRGKAKAPKGATPGVIDPDEVASGLDQVKLRFEELEPRLGELEACRATYRHQLLADLDARQWLKFVKIHHHHHQKLIRDIRLAAERSAA